MSIEALPNLIAGLLFVNTVQVLLLIWVGVGLHGIDRRPHGLDSDQQEAFGPRSVSDLTESRKEHDA
ncbi:MAG: hypothetical protein F4Z18_08305 [Caldilineaceae bacterium SB0666_bin_21]|nr:hypothetical protein [Caldilineaceae bacterium SB0666_bin_21]